MTDKKNLFENTGIFSAILALALPSIAGQIILVVYNMADTLFVGMTGSDAMITAVTVCMPAFMFLSAISNLFGVGGASLIARSFGKGNAEKAKNVSRFSVWGCLAVTVLYCLGVFAFSDRFLVLLGGSDIAVKNDARAYLLTAVVFGGTGASMSTLLSHLVRAYGYSLQAGIGVVVGGVLNIALDPLFMFVLFPRGNEALGAAAATAVSNFVSLIYYVILILRRRDKILVRFRPAKKMFSSGIPGGVFRVGIAACLMTLCENISYAILDKLMAAAGTAAQAGVGVAKKVNMLAHCFVRGMSQGVLPLIAYNYSSGNRTRMKRVLYLSGAISAGMSLICLAVSFRFAGPLIGLFIRVSGASRDFGVRFLRILCIGAPFSSVAYTVISFFQAAGRGGRSLILALLRKGVVDIPLMFLLNRLIHPEGIVMATPLTDILCSLTAAAMFFAYIRRHGKDKPVPAPELP